MIAKSVRQIARWMVIKWFENKQKNFKNNTITNTEKASEGR